MSFISKRQYSLSSSVKIKYHGLRNQGSTCYLNSVLQVLFMTKEFRQNLKVPRRKNEDLNIIDRELTELFRELEKRTATTNNITKKLDIRNVWEQRDAAEYFERILRLTSEEVSKVFHGELINRNICSKCETDTDISAAFWYLPLALVDSYGDYSVLKGVEDFFRPSELSGENQMYCKHCGDKSDATIQCVLERHPEVLVLLLKRFDFDMRYMSYVKIDCAVNVPSTLQIPQDQTYELFAFVDHFGNLRSGHYTTTIKSQDDDKWYMFDDSSVSQCHYQWFQLDTTEKLAKAYLLFYRKHKAEPADTSSQDIGVVSAPGVQQVDVTMKKDGLETEDPPTRDVDVNATASVSTEDVSELKRPAAPPEPPFNHDDEGDVRRNKPPHQQDGDEDEDRGHTRIKKQKEDNDGKYMTSPDDQRRTKEAEGVKNEGVGEQSDPQNILHTHNVMPYVSENQTRWGKRGHVRDGTWIEMDEKVRRKEHQKNEEIHHVADPHPVTVQMPSGDEETNSAGNCADTSNAQVELNPEAITGKREGIFDVSGNISTEQVRATDVNRDCGEDGDDKKRPERLDSGKERRRQEREHKPGHDLQKADEEMTGTGDSGTGRAEMCRDGMRESGKLWKIYDLCNQNINLNERNSPKEGISDSNRRYDDQREDRMDVDGVGDGPRRQSSTNSLTYHSTSRKGDEEQIKYILTKPKQGDFNDRKVCEKLNTKEKSDTKTLDEDEQRSRDHEQRRRRSDRDSSSRRNNPGRNRSPEQQRSPTQTEAELDLKGGSFRKLLSDDRHETHGRPPTDDATGGRRRLKAETETQNNSNNHQVRTETQSDAQDHLNKDMKKLRLAEKPLKRISGEELEANGKNQAKKKCYSSSLSFMCCECCKSKTDSE